MGAVRNIVEPEHAAKREANAEASPKRQPGLKEITGTVLSVRDDPGQWEVRLKAETPVVETIVCRVTEEELLADARGLGKQKIRAMLLEHDGVRLLWIKDAKAPARLTHVDRDLDVMKRWDGLLARLAT